MFQGERLIARYQTISKMTDPLDPETIASKSSTDYFFLKLARFAGGIFVLLLAAWLIHQLVSVVVVTLLSLMLVASLSPILKRLQTKFSKHVSVSIIIATILIALVGFLTLTIPPIVSQAGNLLGNVPKYSKQIEKSLGKAGPAFHRATGKWTSPTTASSVEPQTVQSVGLEVLGFLTGLATVLIMTTYLLADGSRVASTLTGLFPRENRLLLRRLFGEIGEQVGEYIRGQAITSGLACGFTAVFLWALGVPEPLALAGLMAIADAIPMVGIFIGTVPAVLMALTKDTSTAVIVFVGYVLYHLLESYVIVPRIYGKMMKMPAVAILLAILIGSSLWGVLGALFALPTAAAIPILLRYWEEWRAQSERLETSKSRPDDVSQSV
jgi:predicted PurR-regulated permease PerM